MINLKMNKQLQKAIVGKITEATKENSTSVTFHPIQSNKSLYINQSPLNAREGSHIGHPPIGKIISSNNSTKHSTRNAKSDGRHPFISQSKIGNRCINLSYETNQPVIQQPAFTSLKKNSSGDSSMLDLDNLLIQAKNKLESKPCSNNKLLLHTNPESPTSAIKYFNAKADTVKNENNNKWKQFGMMMADAYEQLKIKYKNVRSNTKSNCIIEELKSQNEKLKKLLSLRNGEVSNEQCEKLKNQIKILQSELQSKDKELEMAQHESSLNTGVAQQWQNKYEV